MALAGKYCVLHENDDYFRCGQVTAEVGYDYILVRWFRADGSEECPHDFGMTLWALSTMLVKPGKVPKWEFFENRDQLDSYRRHVTGEEDIPEAPEQVARMH